MASIKGTIRLGLYQISVRMNPEELQDIENYLRQGECPVRMEKKDKANFTTPGQIGRRCSNVSV